MFKHQIAFVELSLENTNNGLTEESIIAIKECDKKRAMEKLQSLLSSEKKLKSVKIKIKRSFINPQGNFIEADEEAFLETQKS